MLSKFKKIANIVYWVAIALLFLLVSGTALSVVEGPFGYRMFVVLTGSMEPELNAGDVVLVHSQDEYSQGDIVTYLKNPGDSVKDIKATITHRIFEVFDDEGRPTYKTKGDANNAPDLEMITKKQVLGKVILSVPYLGRAIAFTRTDVGFVSLIIIPTVLIIYNEALTIKTEIKKLILKRQEKDK